MRKLIICLVFCSLGLFLPACSEDPVLTLQTKMDAMVVWKARAQGMIDALRADVTNLQSQRIYSKDEVDAMIKALKDDQSWVKTGIVTPSVSSSTFSSSPSAGDLTWKYGTYRIEGSIQDIYFEGRDQRWRIVVLNTSQSYVRVIPSISFKIYANPQRNIYTSSGASLTWDNEQDGTAFGPTGVLCGSKSAPFNMPVGIQMDSSGLNNLSLGIYPNVINTDVNGAYTNFTNSLTITPNCGGTNGLGSVLVGPGQSTVWTLSATIDTHQGLVNKTEETNYSSGPWSMGVSFLTDVYQ